MQNKFRGLTINKMTFHMKIG